MKNTLLFDFTVDKSTNTVFVNREFAAELPLVWDAFTKPEILDRWWAPKPWKSETKYMDFKVGGRRFYAMISPEGEKHWSVQDFTSITPKTNFKFKDAFADKNENLNSEFPSSHWDLNFSQQNETTKVSITIKHETLADLEKIIEMGFKEGFTMTLNELDNILTNQSESGPGNKITISATIGANAEKVWQLYNQPEHITKWNFANDDWMCPSASNDMRVGGKYTARMEAKDGSFGFDFEAVYDEIVEGEKFIYTLTDGRKVEVNFQEAGNDTEVIITFDPESGNSPEMQRAGWQAILDNFKRYTESH